jgi:hypothetical protein
MIEALILEIRGILRIAVAGWVARALDERAKNAYIDSSRAARFFSSSRFWTLAAISPGDLMRVSVGETGFTRH